MTRILRLFRRFNGQKTANGMSLFVAGFAILFLHLESSPTPAGADVARRVTNKQSLTFESMTQKNPAVDPKVTQDEIQSDLTPEQRHENDLITKIKLIERGLDFLAKTPDYTAQFVKQELVGGDLLEEQEIDIKVRHAPFSIYMKWNTGEQGREVLYVDGANDGRMTAHGGGWKARLPSVSLDPSCGIAMAESRYPVNKAGLYELAKLMLDVHKEDLEKKRYSRCEKLADQSFDGRSCHVFMIEYKGPQICEHYRKSICLIDKEWAIPVYTRNFGWLNGDVPADPEQHDNASLIEFYSYSNVKFRSNLIALDFDHTNEDYRFKRQ